MHWLVYHGVQLTLVLHCVGVSKAPTCVYVSYTRDWVVRSRLALIIFGNNFKNNRWAKELRIIPE